MAGAPRQERISSSPGGAGFGHRRRAHGAAAALLLVVVTLAAVALLPAAEAGSGDRPKIISATATWHRVTKKVAFSVEIHRNPRKVVVIHGGKHLPASKVFHLPATWETRNVQARKRRCYRIRVKARNSHGLSTRRMHAGRIGSRGCRYPNG